MIAQMNNLLPEEFCSTFEPMCMEAPRTSFSDVQRIFKEDTGLNIEDVFSKFSEEPIASASLAQVHRAVLKRTGETVAVKIQHIWLKESIPGDLNII